MKENVPPGGSYQYDPDAVQLHEVPVDTAGVCLEEAGYQPNHVQPGVPHGGVQHAPRRLHHAFLRERELAMNKLSDPIHVSE